jgi:chitosanase
MDELQQRTARAIVNVFETGRIRGNYSAIAVLKGDSGHLSYGRSQATLGSGSLFSLLETYCQQANAVFASRLRPFLAGVQRKDVRLDTDDTFKRLLRDAGAQDPVMRATQDQFFNNHYFVPACTAAEALGITDPLGITVVYDSHVQGGWGKVKSRVGPIDGGDARGWVRKYIARREEWLKSLKDPLPNTVYRMRSFDSLMGAGKWDLALPLTAHGVQITEVALSEETPQTAGAPRTLTLNSTYLRGDDVLAVQRALSAKGLPVGVPDGIYGPFTHQLVSEWQGRQSPPIAENGVGKDTRRSLGLQVT